MARSTGRLPVLAGKSALMTSNAMSVPSQRLVVRGSKTSRRRTALSRRRTEGLLQEEEGLAFPAQSTELKLRWQTRGLVTGSLWE